MSANEPPRRSKTTGKGVIRLMQLRRQTVERDSGERSDLLNSTSFVKCRLNRFGGLIDTVHFTERQLNTAVNRDRTAGNVLARRIT